MFFYRSIRLSSLAKKYLMASTGLFLGSFLLFHVAGNSLVLYDRDLFVSYAQHLQSLGLLVIIAEIFLGSVFLIHIVTGLSLILSNRTAKGQNYAIKTSALGWRGWPSRIMPITGTGVLLFLLLHLITLRFMDQAASIPERMERVLTEPLLAVLYFVGIVVLSLHISHGFWSLTQSFGINYPRWNGIIKGLGWLATFFSFAVFTTIIFVYAVSF
jgi:succinate dehydrogenase / fumarate reductase cytochrome b subunit